LVCVTGIWERAEAGLKGIVSGKYKIDSMHAANRK